MAQGWICLVLARDLQWSPGDTVSLNFPMSPEVVASNPRVSENRGRVAVQRGPVVYCMEQLDQPNTPAMADVAILANPPAAKAFQVEYKSDLLDGVTVLHHNGAALEISSSKEALYLPASPDAPKIRPQNLTLISYYVWANRQATPMRVIQGAAVSIRLASGPLRLCRGLEFAGASPCKRTR
jgi:DUF1680 family protein